MIKLKEGLTLESVMGFAKHLDEEFTNLELSIGQAEGMHKVVSQLPVLIAQVMTFDFVVRQVTELTDDNKTSLIRWKDGFTKRADELIFKVMQSPYKQEYLQHLHNEYYNRWSHQNSSLA